MNPADWLWQKVDELTDRIVAVSPSELAESIRRLPPSVGPMAGPYRYKVTPYLQQIVDCFDSRSPVREVAIMKGTQTGGTVGVGENAILYWIAHKKTSPVMFVTADQALAALRMDEYITPMIEESGIAHLIQHNSSDNRKQGKTARKMSWRGGGFLLPVSANSAASLRSASIQNIVCDELDAWPLRVGRDGDPVAVVKRRTGAFSKSRKIMMISTPTTDEESRIKVEYERGDQRKYKVPCQGCGEFDEIRWSYTDSKGVQEGGIVWDTDEHGNVVAGSVRYACRHCGFCHINEHKRDMLRDGRWEATAVPSHPTIRSYHISGLMSPPDFYSWEQAVVDWLLAWDVKNKVARCKEKLQEFYNNVLGKPFKLKGTRLTLANVGRHVRSYQSGRVPNDIAEPMCGGKIGFLTLAVDVQDKFISAAVEAWGPNRLGFLVDRYVFEGETDDPFDTKGPWGRVADLIESKFPDGDGREYPITCTLVDSGHRNSEVYSFCSQFQNGGVYPIKGDSRVGEGPIKEFKAMKNASQSGVDGWIVNVNHYKMRLASVLRASPRGSNEPGLVDSVSLPDDLTNEGMKELIGEELITEKGRLVWKRRASRNELWDLTVYNSAARDIAAHLICLEHFQLDTVPWGEFWQFVESIKFGWAEVPPIAPG